MRLTFRSHIALVVGLLAATFGLGQLWSLALALRSGNVAILQIVVGSLGLLAFIGASLVVGRILCVVGQASRSKTDSGGRR